MAQSSLKSLLSLRLLPSLRSFLSLLSLLFLAFPSFAQDGVPVPVSTLSARQPSLDALPNGDCAVAWTRLEQSSGAAAIQVRRRENLRWEAIETPCPPRPGVPVGEPLVRLDSTGNSHLIWVASERETSSLEYAFRVGSNWTRFGFLAEPSPRKIEHPAMMLRPPNHTTRHTDEVFFAWQERAGSNYRIRSYVIDAAAETHAFVLAGEELPQYVVYPCLLELPPLQAGGEPRMGLCWFNLDKPETRIETRVWNDQTGQWDPLDLLPWDPESLRTLPLVLSTPVAEPFLLGVNPLDQLFVTRGETGLYALTENPYVHNRFPHAGRPVRGAFGLVWQQETNAGVELVQAALRPGEGLYASPLAPTDDPFLPSEPDVALTGDSLVSVWVGSAFSPSGAELSADSARLPLPVVFFCETRIPKDGWRPLAPSTEDFIP